MMNSFRAGVVGCLIPSLAYTLAQEPIMQANSQTSGLPPDAGLRPSPVGRGPGHFGGLLSPAISASTGTGRPFAVKGPVQSPERQNLYGGPWLDIHQNFASFVLHELRFCDGPRNNLLELSKQWAEWDSLTSLASYQSVVNILLKYLGNKDLRKSAAAETSQKLSQDVSTVLRQMTLVLGNLETCRLFLACRGTVAQQLLDLLQDLLDICYESTSRPVLSTALLRLSRESGLHPQCFTLSGLQKVGQQVAGGGYGDIWKGFVGGQTVAVKSMRIFQEVDVKAALKGFGREAVIWRQLSHPNLLPFFGLYYLDTRLCLVSPWMEKGHLLDFFKNAPSDINPVSLILDIAMGLGHLHSKNVVHGDLKATNILVTPSNRACIADFGLSSIVDVISLQFTHSTPRPQGGTARYQAPELLLGQSSIHFASDVYAFACVCYEILTARAPFFDLTNDAAVIMKVVEGHRPSRPSTVLQDDLWRLIEDCWTPEPNQRPTMTEILQRLISLPVAVKRTQSEIGWDETYSARFRRSVQQWPLLPSITQIEHRMSSNGLSPPKHSCRTV
ncbi:kinase-like domain-containing protein [Mycena rosella]|uniref:Kinase-like domain-containing protein n=1 Tax=Mycena rosella TaxID=1033263 RepID=A0AAD7GEU2_MYCRO|nr:kinase-like domain-containing protein [Mycena rosella]